MVSIRAALLCSLAVSSSNAFISFDSTEHGKLPHFVSGNSRFPFLSTKPLRREEILSAASIIMAPPVQQASKRHGASSRIASAHQIATVFSVEKSLLGFVQKLVERRVSQNPTASASGLGFRSTVPALHAPLFFCFKICR